MTAETATVAFNSALAVLLAGFLGSFVAAMWDRVPVGDSVTRRSRCVCGRTLGPVDLLPVIGWVAQRGVARCCGAAIPRRLLAAEAVPMSVTAAAVLLLGQAGQVSAALPLVALVPLMQRRATAR